MLKFAIICTVATYNFPFLWICNCSLKSQLLNHVSQWCVAWCCVPKANFTELHGATVFILMPWNRLFDVLMHQRHVVWLLLSIIFTRRQKMHSNERSEKSWTYMPTLSLGSASFPHQTINKLFSVATEAPVSKYGSNFSVLSGCHRNRESASLTNHWPLCGVSLGGLAASRLLYNYTFYHCR